MNGAQDVPGYRAPRGTGRTMRTMDALQNSRGGVWVYFGLGRGNPSQYDRSERLLNKRQRWPGRETGLTRKQTSSADIQT